MGERGEANTGACCSPVSAELKTPVSDSSPLCPSIFRSQFQLQPKNKHFPLHYSLSKLCSTHNPRSAGSRCRASHVVTLQRKQSYRMLRTSSAITWYEPARRSAPRLPRRFLTKNRQVRRRNPSLLATSGPKWHGGNAPLRMFDF